jgi:hypothetical protein
VLSGGVKVLVDQLLLVRHERFVQRYSLRVLHALDVAVECVLDQ